jgi:Na+/H+ antiporter NhaD/arsenite permease-like protein
MEHAAVLDMIGLVFAWLIGWGDYCGAAALCLSPAAFSSVTDNIPLAAMLTKMLAN